MSQIRKLKPAEDAEPDPDGRRRRSERSRRKIVDALFRLIRRGEVNASAAAVAEEADVSLRTVFRHFEEMDSLYQEMNADMEAAIMPRVQQPFKGRDWQEQLDELLARRAEIHEEIMLVKTAADLRRHQSEFLQDDHRRFLGIERTALHNVLPETIKSDPTLLAELEWLTSFDSWRRLRREQGLDPDMTRQVIRAAVEAVLKQANHL